MIHSSWVCVAPVLRARSGRATFSDAIAAATAPRARQTTAVTAAVLVLRVPDRDRMPVALHGWSYAQTDQETRAALQASLHSFRDRCVPLVKQWQTDGLIAADVEPDAVAQFILSICLGFVAQRSLTGDAEVQAHADALAALTAAHPAGIGAPGSRTP
jgi:hypothetical protein